MTDVSLPSLEWLRKQLQEADPDLLRAMVESVVATLMGAEADALCGAAYGERHPERTNRRNGYRERAWDTRLGTIALPIPKLRHGSYFPDWLLEPRRRAERALVQVVAEAYLLGVSVRRIETLVQALGIDRLSKSRVETQCLLPCAETAAMLFWVLLASGQSTLRRVDGWQTLERSPTDLDLAA